MGLQNVNTMNKLNFTLTLFFLGICFLTPLSSQTPTASFATWKDNKKAAYSIIHDDYSDYVTGIFQYADPIATARGIKLCFGAITSACGPLEWANAKTMMSHGHECINHSHNHLCGGTAGQCSGLTTYGPTNFATELDFSTQLIEINTGVRPRFFIHPYDAPSDAILNHLNNNLGYLGSRAGTQLAVNANTFTDFMRLNFYVYDGTDAALTSLNTAVNSAISSGGYVVREFHGIDDGSWSAMTVANYTNHLDYVKTKMDDGSIWSATPTEAITYKMQRDAFQPVVAYTASTGIINVTFNTLKTIDPSVLRTPVTVNINLNGIAGTYSVSQNNSNVISTRVGNVISFNVYPNQGAVTLKCTDCAPPQPLNIFNLTATPQTNAVLLNWSNPASNFDEIMIVAKPTSGFTTIPTGTIYASDANFTGAGTAFEGGKVIYRGAGATVTVTNLVGGTTYYFRAYTRLGNIWSSGVEVNVIPNSIVIPPVCGPDGKIVREYWNNVTYLISPSITYLTIDSRYPNNPTSRDTLSEFRSSNKGDTYGERAKGYIVPKESGVFTFYVTGDDNVDFYLSTTDNASNKRRICRISGLTGETQFNKYSSQKSLAINLVAGQYYYFELQHVQGTGTNHFGAFWQTPSNSTITLIDKAFFSSKTCSAIALQAATAQYFAFDGRLEGDKALLNWVSKSVNETDYFILEKADEKTGEFRQLDIINSWDKNQSLQAFSYSDPNLIDGDNFYRLKTVFQNGSHVKGNSLERYSEIVKVRFDRPNLYDVFPNPTTDYFSIDLSPANGKAVDIKIITLLGKVVKQERIETPSVFHRFELGDLPSGQYFIHIQPQSKRLVMKKLMIIK